MEDNRHRARHCFILFLSLFLLSACNKEGPDANILYTGTFLIGSKGEDDARRGLYTVKAGSAPVFVTEIIPYNFSCWYMHINNDVLAYRVSSTQKLNTSGIAYARTDDLSNVLFAPIPGAPEGYYYSVATQPPRVLSDGRIAYLVALETDSPYDNWFAGQIAIFNPESGDIELSGDPSEFVRNQPEIGVDTEDGTMKSGFAVSPDDRYIYCEAYGYGTDFGEVHRDYSFIVRYTIGSPGSYERVYQMAGLPLGETPGGEELIVTSDSKLYQIDLTTKAVTELAEYAYFPLPGQMSSKSQKMIRSWGSTNSHSAGISELNHTQIPMSETQIIDDEQMEVPRYRIVSLKWGGVYDASESGIYLGLSRRLNNENFYNIAHAPLGDLSENPDSITSFPTDYDMGVFIYLGE